MFYSEYMPVECLMVPKVLFRDIRYHRLSTTAKVLYSMFLARKDYAALNGWVDNRGRYYVIYPKREMAKDLNCTRYRVDDVVAELEKTAGMIRVVRENGKPNRFYINDISIKDEWRRQNMRTMSEMKEQKTPIDKRKRIDRMMEKACKIIAEFFGTEEIEDDCRKPEEHKKNAGAGSGKSMETTKNTDDVESMETGDDTYTEDPMEIRGYMDEAGNLDIERIQYDAGEYGMELALSVEGMFRNSSDKIEMIRDLFNEVYKDYSMKEFMAVVETVALICGACGVYADDMRACNKKARRIYLKELIEDFNMYLRMPCIGDLVD